MVGGKLGEHKGGKCKLLHEALHVVPQVSFIYHALKETWLDAAGKRLTFVGRLDEMEAHWEALGRLVLRKVAEGLGQGTMSGEGARGAGAWPAYRSDLWAVPWFPNRQSNPHAATNAESDNGARHNMDALTGSGDDHPQAENPEAQLALCRIFLPDYVCFGYELPEACAAIIGSQHGISCPWPWMLAALDAASAPERVPITEASNAPTTCAAFC